VTPTPPTADSTGVNNGIESQKQTHHAQHPSTMKLTSLILIASSFLTVQAFGVNPKRTALVKDAAVKSPLFRDPTKMRAGAVPGWAAYNRALDDKPLITKAMTSLVGWGLGDFLAQVRSRYQQWVFGGLFDCLVPFDSCETLLLIAFQ
jgi:hypothetical protein